MKARSYLALFIAFCLLLQLVPMEFAKASDTQNFPDFELDATSLRLPETSLSGRTISLIARVFNRSPGGKRAGGSVVRFLINGETVDEVPFYLADGQTHADVRVLYRIPEGPYASMSSGELPMTVTAVVDPYDRIPERDEENNLASDMILIRYAGDQEIKSILHSIQVDASGLSARSRKYDVKGDWVSAAQPGRVLKLKAQMPYVGTGKFKTEGINVKFLIDGEVILDDNRQARYTWDGVLVSECEYYVPFNRTRPLDFRVALNNGSTAGITIPILAYDLSVRPESIFNNSSNLIRPGGSISPRVRIRNQSSVMFPNDGAGIAWRALVDGVQVAEGLHRPLVGDEQIVSLPRIDIPPDRTEPIVVTVITDAYDQLEESDETNNIATLEIPVLQDALSGPNYYMLPGSLTVSPSYSGSAAGDPGHSILQNTQLTISASVYAQGQVQSAIWGKTVKLRLSVNGAEIQTKSIPCSSLNAFLPRTVSFEWTVPDDMNGTAVFMAELDPQTAGGDGEDGTIGEYQETDEQDNVVTAAYSLMKPDLDLTAGDSLSCQPQQPVAGREATLTALVRNNSVAPAHNVTVRFLVNGQEAGSALIPRIGGNSAVSASIPWTPVVPPGEEPYPTLQGMTGWFVPPAALTPPFTLQAIVDPGNEIPETSEANNSSPQRAIDVTVLSDKQIVRVSAEESQYGPIPGVLVTLTVLDGSSTAQAETNQSGFCSFTGVPPGTYVLSASKEGYSVFSGSGQYITSQNSDFDYPRVTMKREQGEQAFIELVSDDPDNDLLSNDEEAYYGTDPLNPDSDGDGVIDGKDLSPAIHPEDPDKSLITSLQEPGMIRLQQPIVAYGLDGWVDVDKPWPQEDTREEDEGTWHSVMSDLNIIKAADKYYYPIYACGYIEDKTPLDFAYNDVEKVHDHLREAYYPVTQTIGTDWHFCYDYLTDYKLIHLMNIKPIYYPNFGGAFTYLMFPVRLEPLRQNTFRFQMRQFDLASLLVQSAGDPLARLYIQYDLLHKGRAKDQDLWYMPLHSGLAEASVNSFDQYNGKSLVDLTISIPGEAIFADSFQNTYLKLTPLVWRQESGGESLHPCTLDWELSGIMREVVYSQDMAGNSSRLREHVNSLEALNTPFMGRSAVENASDSEKKTITTDEEVLVYDPAAASSTSRVTWLQLARSCSSVSLKTAKGVNKVIELIKVTATEAHQVSKIDDLPESSIFKSAGYASVTNSLTTAKGILSIWTDGTDAYLAYQNGDTVECVYYTMKTVQDTAELGIDVTKMVMKSRNTVTVTSGSGKLNWLFGNKTKAGLALAAGLIEIGYNAYKWQDTDDPFKKAVYAEQIESEVIDTSLNVAAVFFPPLKAALLVWELERMAYGFIFGKDFAYRMTESPGKAYVYIRQSGSGEIPTCHIQDSYNAVRKNLIELLETINNTGMPEYPFVALFVDPEDN